MPPQQEYTSPVSLMFGHMTCVGLLIRAKYFAEPWLWEGYAWDSAWLMELNRHVTGRELIRSGGKPSFLCLCGCHQKSFLPWYLSLLRLEPRMHTCAADLSPAKSNGTSSAGPIAWNRDVEQPHMNEDKCCWVKPFSSGSLFDSNSLCSHHKGKPDIMGNRVGSLLQL